jgi:hypothetical protein
MDERSGLAPLHEINQRSGEAELNSGVGCAPLRGYVI